MKKCMQKGICLVLIFALLATLLPTSVLLAEPGVEPAPDVGLTLSADKSIAVPGDTISFTANFNVLSGMISGYSATQVVVVLPVGLTYAGSVVYIGGAPAVITTSPVTTPMGTSVIVALDNYDTAPGAARFVVSATVDSTWDGTPINIRAELFLQPANNDMPYSPTKTATYTLRYEPPYEPPTPITPQLVTVTFDLRGGSRVGGGALVQTIPMGGAAVEPYVSRQGYIFDGWSVPFDYVTRNLTVVARWTLQADTGPITVDPPAYTAVPGHFLNGRNTFMLHCHRALIFYAERHAMYFSTVEIDGRALTAGTHFVATTGTALDTTAIHLMASYINTLTAGTHSLRVNFRDGTYANAQFTVLAYTAVFYDVVAGDWFNQGVMAMNASELMQGVTATHFNPHTHMTRGMVVTLLYRFAGEPSIAGFVNNFPDVAPGQYYTNAVMWAAANGIVTGHPSGLFAPNDIMTREQFIAVLYRYQNALGSVPTDILMDHEYVDFNRISQYARGPVTKLTMQSVFRDWPGAPASYFNPQAPVTRAEVATVMRLWIESIGW